MAALRTGEKRALQALGEGRRPNASGAAMRALEAAGLVTNGAGGYQLTPAGHKRVQRLASASGTMHRRTWHVGVSQPKAPPAPCCPYCGGRIVEDDPDAAWPYCENCKAV